MFACVFIPDFTVEAVLRAEPTLRAQAVAVVEGKPPLCYVVGVNDHAREAGIVIGMPRAELQAARVESESRKVQVDREKQRAEQKPLPERMQHMRDGLWSGGMYRASAGEAVIEKERAAAKRRSTEVTIRTRSAAQEVSAHAALLDAAHAISPRVEGTAPDTVVLDVDGLERLFGSPVQIAQELMRRLGEVGLCGNVAIAANPNAAEHAARGFNGVTILPAGREADRLGALLLGVLFAAEASALSRARIRDDQQRKAIDRLGRMQGTLDRWGVRNFRGLAALPPVSLSERLGADGVRLQKLAAGQANRDLVLSDPPLHFEETIELDYPVDVLESVAFLLARLLEGVCSRLAARALSTNELRLRMKLEHRTGDEAAKTEEELAGEPIVERKLTLPVPMNDTRLFLKLLQLELSANPPGAPVTQLWVSAEPARPRVTQTGLFLPLAPEPEKLELTLARIHKLLGDRERAGTAEMVDTHQPDAFKVLRFRETVESRKSKVAEEVACDSALALRRFRPPLEAEVDVRDGAPVRVLCMELGTHRALHDNVVWSAGPWRSSGNWWEEKCSAAQAEHIAHAFDREEWDVALTITRGVRRERETEIGLFRLIRQSEGWRLEGQYD